jgi:hypothetical protein
LPRLWAATQFGSYFVARPSWSRPGGSEDASATNQNESLPALGERLAQCFMDQVLLAWCFSADGSYNGISGTRPRGSPVTVDEELSRLEENIRRLKIEYEAYFNGGNPRPPNDTLYRVEQAIKRYSSDAGRLNVSQRFRFNNLWQRYAVHNDLWRKRLRNREEGRETALRSHAAEADSATQIVVRDPDREQAKVDRLLQALVDAKQRVGERADNIGPARFQKFVREKTRQLKQELGCDSVLFSVTVKDGRVRFTAVNADS